MMRTTSHRRPTGGDTDNHRLLTMQSVPDFARSMELDKADAEYARSLKNDPSLVDAWRMRARIAMERQRNTDAAKLLMQGIEYNPEDLVLVGDLANLHLLNRDATAARPLVERLLRSDGEKPENLYSQARLLWIDGDYEGALEFFRRAATKRPTERRFAMSLIQSLTALEDWPGALIELERWRGPEATGEMGALLALYRYDSAGPEAALAAVTEAVGFMPEHPFLNYLYAALLTLGGFTAKAVLPISMIENDERMGPRWRGFQFARKQGGGAPFCGSETTLLDRALAAAPAAGEVLEFGVYYGLSLRKIAKRVSTPIHGFDSFEGLPEDWKPGEPKGCYSTGGRMPAVPAHVQLHRGWFEDTLPAFAAKAGKLRFVHVDCDLYSSTRTVLEGLRPLLQPGTVFMFDEFMGFEGYEQHEFRAWHEFVERHRIKYRYTGFSLMAKQVALQVTAL